MAIKKTGKEPEIGIQEVLLERGSRYGSFKSHARITQDLKTVMYRAPNYQHNQLLPSMKESLEMIQHKIGRILNGDPQYLDSWVDIVGYAQLVVDELEYFESQERIKNL